MKDPNSGMTAIEAELQRLENEREACKASLQKLDADLLHLEAERERLEDVVKPDPLARLHLLASMGDELRTALHGILGYVQLFRIRGGLDSVQTEWVNAMLAAGTQLLGKVHCVVGLADIEAEPGGWLVDEGGLPAGFPAEPAIAPSTAPANIRPIFLEQGPEPVPKQGPEQGAEQAPQPVLRVLVVDDVAMNRDIASSFIRAAGHSVVLADSGARAVTAAGQADFDVILMDVRMPGVDGLEATRLIRALPGANGHVPIIALTAQAFSDKVEACRAAGMNGHLAKPFRYDTLNEAILSAAAEGKARRADPAPSQSIAMQSQAGQFQMGDPKRSVFSVPEAQQTQGRPRGASQGWIDIVSPWNNSSAAGQSSQSGPGAAYILDTQFKVKLTAIEFNRGRQLVGGAVRCCAPPCDRPQHEFHWLLYTEPAATDVRIYTSSCDLWRWSHSTWQSIAVPGAHFSPDEMYEQGWRYCGPCVEKTATVEVV